MVLNCAFHHALNSLVQFTLSLVQ
eukprot:SAG22_NODE_18381_length_288_cov_0.941799_1_plen_23_part_10